jgi:hypothetical protein
MKRKNINQTLNGQYINFYNHLKSVNPDEQKIVPAFKNQWMNFSIYFENFKYESTSNPSFGYVSPFVTNFYALKDNDRDIGGKQTNTKWLANGTYIQTNFILVDKSDLIKFYDYRINNVKQLGFRIPKSELKGTYLRQERPPSSTAQYFNQDNGDEYYFLIGTLSTSNNNVLEYLIDSKII